ncbi:RadC family protein [Parasphingorhabdus cellanae]|uniref:DNA repair protein RadC n=1 Tax=Parasphingorhabdus cellanae TaxID=2806553 RepID=A0ABX7T4E7_9SPHN|nr:DNA repair protein RadC [Parasphingorhabdus cellanae]QTD56006.1 DNA repair protein RadC [Parasphingorhabdus cellanae]
MAKLDDAEISKIHHGKGHRARLRGRLLNGGGDTLLDHELVEYLLAIAIPRRDTKPLAKELIETFGGLSALLTADGQSIQKVPGMGETSAAAIKIVQAAALRLISEPIREQPILTSWQALLDYLRADMAHLVHERVRVLHLNSKNRLIRDELVSEGSIDQAAIYTREVIKRALELGSAAIILVHNHPSGDSAPSRQDIAITKDICDAGRKLGIAVHDHIIIGKDGHTSFRSKGLI